MSPSMSLVRKYGAALAFSSTLLLGGCTVAAKVEPATPVQAEDPAAVHPEIWPSPKWPFEKDPALEEKVAALLKKMTVEEKVGQVIQGDICCIKPEDMKKYHLGSILAGGGSSPGNNERAPQLSALPWPHPCIRAAGMARARGRQRVWTGQETWKGTSRTPVFGRGQPMLSQAEIRELARVSLTGFW